ncbi:hypothetical protein QBC46DRAFT_244325, partial [Diplogelasinospora grovesii]
LLALPALAAAIPLISQIEKLAYALPASLPTSFFEDDSCNLPASFEIAEFQTWSPAAGNTDHGPVINFGYKDNGTGIDTECHYNSSSVNVGPEGLTPRYACDNSYVTFIYQNDTNVLTVIEVACPGSSGSTRFEASGSVQPPLTCLSTESDSPFGNGTDCLSQETFIYANFTSLQPTPS